MQVITCQASLQLARRKNQRQPTPGVKLEETPTCQTTLRMCHVTWSATQWGWLEQAVYNMRWLHDTHQTSARTATFNNLPATPRKNTMHARLLRQLRAQIAPAKCYTFSLQDAAAGTHRVQKHLGDGGFKSLSNTRRLRSLRKRVFPAVTVGTQGRDNNMSGATSAGY